MKAEKARKQRFRLRRKGPEGYLTTKETAAFLGVSVRTVHRYIHAHGLPAKKPGGVWLISKEELLQWMKENG